MRSPLRKSDELAALSVSRFLERHFYVLTTDYKRTETIEDDIKGIDCTFCLGDKRYVCDEKAAVKYVNRPLKTFAFELSFINSGGNLHQGWLLDESHINDSFLLVWVDYGTQNEITDEEQITEATVALVKKNRIKQYLSSIGWTNEKLSEKQRRIRNNANKEYLGDINRDGCRFVFSKHLHEQPINVLIDREILCEFADFCRIFKK